MAVKLTEQTNGSHIYIMDCLFDRSFKIKTQLHRHMRHYRFFECYQISVGENSNQRLCINRANRRRTVINNRKDIFIVNKVRRPTIVHDPIVAPLTID